MYISFDPNIILKNNSIYTKIDFFSEKTTHFLTADYIENLDDNSFAERAYSWRGKSVIKRNLEILEKKEV